MDSDINEKPSLRVPRKVAAMKNIPVRDLPALADSIDPDALDAIVGSTPASTVTFPYAGQLITVTAAGQISVQQIEADESKDRGFSKR